MHWFPCLNGRRALIARCTISIGFSSNLSRSLYSGLSVRLLVSANNPHGGSTDSISSSRLRQLKRACISRLVHKFQIESERLSDHDGGSRHYADAHNDSALGPALLAGIREALEPICSGGWMRHILRLAEDGSTCIGPWTRQAGRSISF